MKIDIYKDCLIIDPYQQSASNSHEINDILERRSQHKILTQIKTNNDPLLSEIIRRPHTSYMLDNLFNLDFDMLLFNATYNVLRIPIDDKTMFDKYINAFDFLDGTDTWFVDMSLKELSMYSRPDYIIVVHDIFGDEDGTKTITSRDPESNAIDIFHSIHRLRQEKLTGLFSLALLPEYERLHPGATRVSLCEIDTDRHDIMITNLTNKALEAQHCYKKCNDYTLKHYDGIVLFSDKLENYRGIYHSNNGYFKEARNILDFQYYDLEGDFEITVTKKGNKIWYFDDLLLEFKGGYWTPVKL